MPTPTLINGLHIQNTSPNVRDNGPSTSSAFDVVAGDVLCLKLMTEDSGSVPTTPTNTGTALTWTEQVTTGAVASREYGKIWTAVPPANQTGITVSFNTGNNPNGRGATLNQWRDAQLVGTPPENTTKTGTGAPSTSITPVAVDSVIDCICGDWNSGTAARTYRAPAGLTTATEQHVRAMNDGSAVMQYETWYHFVTATGAKTIGLSLPAGQNWCICAVEIQYLAPSVVSVPGLFPVF